MKTYRWGILGTGVIAKKMTDALALVPQSQLVAVASRDINKAREFANQNAIEKAYGSYEDLVKDADIDIVYVATPHSNHCTNTLLALNNGRNVLCEKPLAVNGHEVREMIACAGKNNRFLMEAMWSRFLPNIIKAKEIIDSGTLGKVNLITADFGIGVPFNAQHRLYNRELAGGSLLDLGVYPLFLSLLLLGKPDDISASAVIGATKVDYTCSFTLKYGNEALALMHSSILANTDTTAVVYCEKGKIIFDKWWYRPVSFTVVMADGNEERHDFDTPGNGYQYEAMAVVQSLEEGKTQSNLMTWDDSLLLMDTMDAIRRITGINYPGHDK